MEVRQMNVEMYQNKKLFIERFYELMKETRVFDGIIRFEYVYVLNEEWVSETIEVEWTSGYHQTIHVDHDSEWAMLKDIIGGLHV